MNTPTDPFAMVKPGSKNEQDLLSIGWTITDSIDGWNHMEPSL